MYSKERGRRIANRLAEMPLCVGGQTLHTCKTENVWLLEKGFQGLVNTHPQLVEGLNPSQWVGHGRQGLVWKSDVVFGF
jgi:hypothetical protein